MLTKSVWLPKSPEAAFRLFTERISDWWPPDRRHTGDPHSRLTLAADGRFEEQDAAGLVVPLGKVTAWTPGQHLRLDFYPGTDALHPTEVDISFTPENDGTRVTIDHRPTPASAELWATRAPRYAASWTRVLEDFGAFVAQVDEGLADR